MVEINENIKKCVSTEQNVFAWSMRETIARKNSLLIWGNGYLLQSKNEKILKTFKKIEMFNQLPSMLSHVERIASLYGRAIITINATETNEYMLNVVEPIYFNNVGKAFVQPQLAVIWQRITYDNKKFLIETTYDTEKVVNSVWTQNDDGKLLVWAKEAEILKQFRMKKVWYHNLGFVPVVEITNIPFTPTQFENDAYVKIADWFPAYQFESLAFTVKKNLEKELAYCHSRVSIENASQSTIAKLKASNIEDDDFVINADVNSEIKFIPGNGDFTKYTSTLNDIFDFYYKFSGLSRFSEGGGAQKTVAETSSIRSGMIETTNQKIQLREQQIADLIRKVLCCYKVIKNYWEFNENEEFDFRVNGNILKDESSWIDNQLKLIEIGVKTPIDLIQDIFNISQEEAEEKFQCNKEWAEENEFGVGSFEEEENNQDGQLDKTTGEHKNNDKRGEA